MLRTDEAHACCRSVRLQQRKQQQQQEKQRQQQQQETLQAQKHHADQPVDAAAITTTSAAIATAQAQNTLPEERKAAPSEPLTAAQEAEIAGVSQTAAATAAGVAASAAAPAPAAATVVELGALCAAPLVATSQLFQSMRRRISSRDGFSRSSSQQSDKQQQQQQQHEQQEQQQASDPGQQQEAAAGTAAAAGAAAAAAAAEKATAPSGAFSASGRSCTRERLVQADSLRNQDGHVSCCAADRRSASTRALLLGRPPQARAPCPFPADLLPLMEAPVADRPELFRKKLAACCIVYDFESPDFTRDKDLKKRALVEIVEYVNSTRHCFSEQVLQDVMDMVSANIFRPLPPSQHRGAALLEAEEEEPQLDSAWPHIQIVYEFFLRFIVSNDVSAKLAKKFIDHQFVLKFLELFSSEDPRERDYLKTILHRIYGKIMALRFFVRKSIQQVFHRFLNEQESPNGISELLEILGSVINGFAVPLKAEHKLFLERVLLPLHKARSLAAFHKQLTYCMEQYVAKESRVAVPIILGMVRFWPACNAPKVVLFLNELEHVLQETQLPEFQEVMLPLFSRLAECIQSPNFLVAERVLFLWNNEKIVRLINLNRPELFPIIIGALFRSSQQHWSVTVHTLTYNVSKLLAQADTALFDECSSRFVAEEKRRKEQEEERAQRWAALEAEAAAKGGWRAAADGEEQKTVPAH
ncbi:serine/threonine protein phosphatase 2A B56 delta subunit, putative [Eimeria acervulina]|uniref:Serine/threonine protein phosphatase 2A regulatory subunit n=1 Tax=Eimeria acervulina TaxID=5801 RepID=U6G809_EIMAC|nr:serine/threonine protein phosphatase 2A B56 delta subunit, putative [Eimeria acervulina]CDI76386.1 serine/threonine protein phosphatase 2A B56 delta subunit, putative [Eimeria acervulina]